MEFTVVKHPLISHKLSILRDQDTPSTLFRDVVDDLVTRLAYEATRNVKTEPIEVQTPLAKMQGEHLVKHPRPIVVPILRAGLGMLAGMIRCMPTCEVGFLGMKRNEETLQPITYANRLPDDLSGRQCYVIDPMLATGGTLIDTVNYLYERGCRDVTAVCILSAPEGVKALEAAAPQAVNLHVFVGALDECLNEHGYIVPGLGDAGDRLYGSVD
jgi:uracil phosphoribosyltransferase